MQNIICYFSGRGNSLKTALDLSKKLTGASVTPITNDAKLDIKQHNTCIGIITPVICFGVPACVLKFIDRLQCPADTYFYAVAANGGMPFASIRQIEKRLSKKGLALFAGFLIKFGITMHTPDEWNAITEEISQTVLKRDKHLYKTKLKDKLITGICNSLVKRVIPSQDKTFSVDSKCVGCGICVRVCPAGNIKITEGKPVWQHRCEQCAACFNWCPNEAITGTSLAARTRFRNTGVTLEQMMDKSVRTAE